MQILSSGSDETLQEYNVVVIKLDLVLLYIILPILNDQSSMQLRLNFSPENRTI